MGGGHWSDDAYSHISYSRSSSSASSASYFKSTMDSALDPKGVSYRESRDSADHPMSLAIQFYLDVTGSMSGIPKELVGGPGMPGKLSALMSTMLKHNVQDPQIMFCAIGDHECDSSPLQVGQFESETTLLDNGLTSLYLEGGGGGNMGESYLLAWYFASRHTSMDCFEKRGRKGFLFTVGDEKTLPVLPASKIQEIFGDGAQSDLSMEQLLAEAQRTCEVFHIQVSHGSGSYSSEINQWKSLLGERCIITNDYNAIPEIVASTVAMFNGAALADVVKSFDRSIAASVSTALATVNSGSVATTGSGIVSL